MLYRFRACHQTERGLCSQDLDEPDVVPNPLLQELNDTVNLDSGFVGTIENDVVFLFGKDW